MFARQALVFLVAMQLAWRGAFGAPSGPPCAYSHHEVAFVHPGTKGPFQDAAYNNRPLTPHTSICSNSRIVRAVNGQETIDDQLILRGLAGTVFPPFRCKDLLHCKSTILLENILLQVREQLEGKPLWDSIKNTLSRKDAQTSTIPRWSDFASAAQWSQLDDDTPMPRLSNVILTAGNDVTSGLLFPANPRMVPPLDLCMHADRTDCGAALPQPAPLPLQKLPAGLHVLWIARPLKGDTQPIRIDGTAAYIIAAHSSWSPSDLDEARAAASALALNAQLTSAQRWTAIVGLAARLAQPK